MLKTRGIVFRTVKFGETSVIADIFTEEAGLHSFVAGGVRTAKSRMSFSLFQPMTVVELVSYFRDESGAVNRLKELRAGHVFREIPFEVRRGAVVLFMAELCRKCIHEAEANRPLFEYLLDTLIFLDETEQPFANLHLHFLLQLAGFQGFLPQRPSGRGPFFLNLQEGNFSPEPPPHGQFMPPPLVKIMLELMAVPTRECPSVQIARPERKALLEQLLKFFSLHVPGWSEVHTPEVLEMVFLNDK